MNLNSISKRVAGELKTHHSESRSSHHSCGFGRNSRTYRLEFKHELNDLRWSPVGSPITGTGQKVVMQEPAKDHGFYHLVLVP